MKASAFRFSKVVFEAGELHQRLGWRKKGPPYLAQEAIDGLFSKEILVSSSDLGEGVNGIIYRRPETAPGITFIEYNCKDPMTVRNATLAHELGHFVLGHLDDGPVLERRCRITGQKNKITDPKEREANTFMAEFLVPLDRLGLLLREDIARLRWDDPEAFNEEVDLLATKFVVSQSFIKRQVWRLHRRRKDRWGM